jgi:hypothetical protein
LGIATKELRRLVYERKIRYAIVDGIVRIHVLTPVCNAHSDQCGQRIHPLARENIVNLNPTSADHPIARSAGVPLSGKLKHVTRPAFLATTTLAVVLLAGCSGLSKNSASKPSTPATTAKGTTITSLTNPPLATSSTAPVVPSSDQCTASDLQPAWPGTGDGASGSIYFVVNLLNSSSATCVTGGYVGISAYDPAGDLISASESRDLFGSNSAPILSVAPGASIHFIIGLPDSDLADGGTECSTTVGALHLIPPNETTEVQIATPVARGYPSLCGNTFMVGPLQSGATND